MKRIFLSAVAIILSATSVSSARTMKVMGTVTDLEGRPVPGVTVSDSFTAVQTDSEGRYSFVRNEAAYYVHYSIPAGYQVPIRQGIPCFYRRLDRDSVYNFHLIPLKGKPEKEFNLLFMADPQSQNVHHVRRFASETIPDMRAHAKKLKGNEYCITLGDIAYTEGEFNTTYILPMMKYEMEVERTGFPVFRTTGNHDFIQDGLSLNPQNPVPEIRFLRMFEDIFGPIDYSWNRGDAHIVSMNNVMFEELNIGKKYHGEFSATQLEWLRQDLSFVPKDKLVILCCHIPVWGTKKNGPLLEILSQFPNCVIYSGHVHANRPDVLAHDIPEYNLAAASGCWWWSRLNNDGTPHGYQVVQIKGNRIVNQYWKSTRYPVSFQMRLYHGDSVFGGPYERDVLPYGPEVILANVFGWAPGWKVSVYENGKYSGEMERINPEGGRSKQPSVTSCQDWWAIGYHCGVVGRGNIRGSNRNSYISLCTHMFRYTLKDPAAKVKVVAEDPYGNRYEESSFIARDAFAEGSTVYETARPPKYELDPVSEYYH